MIAGTYCSTLRAYPSSSSFMYSIEPYIHIEDRSNPAMILLRHYCHRYLAVEEEIIIIITTTTVTTLEEVTITLTEEVEQ